MAKIRTNRNVTIGLGATLFWVGIIISFGVLISTFTIGITQVMVNKYEDALYKSHFLPIIESRQNNFANVVSQQDLSLSSSRQLLQVNTEEDKQKEAEKEAGKAIISFKESVPRYNSKGERVSNEFNPTNLDYYESLVIIAIPCIIIAFLSCCVGCCFFILRGCCGCCGGRDPKEGGYSLKERFIPKQLLLAVGLITIVAAIFGWIGNANFSQGLTDFFDVIINTTDKVIQTTNSIVNKLRSLSNTNAQSVENSIASLQAGLETFKATAEEAKTTAKNIDDGRLAVINVGFIVAAGAALLGTIGSLMNKGFPCMLMAFVGFVSLTFLWFSFGFHLPISILVADVCVAIDTYVQGAANSNIGSGLNDILQCLGNETYSPSFDLSYNGANDALTNLNNYTMACCNKFYSFENVSSLNMTDFPPSVQPDIQSNLNDFLIFNDILNELLSLADCSIIRKAYKDMEFALCVTMLKGIDTIMGTQGLIGIVFIPGVYLAIIAWKRLPNPKNKQKPNEEGMVDYSGNPQNGNQGNIDGNLYPNDPNNNHVPVFTADRNSVPPPFPHDSHPQIAMYPGYPQHPHEGISSAPSYPIEPPPYPFHPNDVPPSYPIDPNGVPPSYPIDPNGVPPSYPIDPNGVPPQYPPQQ